LQCLQTCFASWSSQRQTLKGEGKKKEKERRQAKNVERKSRKFERKANENLAEQERWPLVQQLWGQLFHLVHAFSSEGKKGLWKKKNGKERGFGRKN
jgi:hypothetical protein